MKIKIDEQNFYGSGKTVVCKLKCMIEFNDCFYDSLHRKLVDRFEPLCLVGWTTISFNVLGKSKCCPTDEFNELTGKRIAEARAFQKAYKIGKQIAQFLKDYYERKCDELYDDVVKYEDLIDEEDLNIDSLSWGSVNGDPSMEEEANSATTK